ncbi:MAG: hypothetical protein PHU21_15125 [Elusimicrobia bacterium]|nr:hypothetical protein [Elusimicrobiota bacterium]
MPDEVKRPPLTLAWLWVFLAFWALGVISLWRDVPFYYAPQPGADGEQAASEPAWGPAAVLPFDDITVAAQVAAGLDGSRPKVKPEALRYAATENGRQLVCELGADSNRLGKVDGASLAKAFARELQAAGYLKGVRYIERFDELRGESVLVNGRVLEASMRILEDGKREYQVELEISAGAAPAEGMPQTPPFWKKTLRGKARSGGAPSAYEIGALVRRLLGEAVGQLREAL